MTKSELCTMIREMINEELDKVNKDNSDLLNSMLSILGDSIKEVRFTNRLKSHPVCLTTKGDISIEMQKVFEKSEEVMWKCRNCGHLVVGKKAPQMCPVCAHPQSYFEIHAENY